MLKGLVNLAHIKPWWLRFTLLFTLGCPMIFGFNQTIFLNGDDSLNKLLLWSLYFLFIWLFIALSVGIDGLFNWLGISVILGLTVAMTGAIFQKLGIWAIIMNLIPWVDPKSFRAPNDVDMVIKLLMIMGTLPYFLLFLGCFPAGDLLRRTADLQRSKFRKTRVVIALFLRVFQHVFEISSKMIIAWREENPDVIIPRFKSDWHRGSLYVVTGFVGWIRSAIWAWALGLLVHSLLFVPVAVRSWSAFLVNQSTKRES